MTRQIRLFSLVLTLLMLITAFSIGCGSDDDSVANGETEGTDAADDGTDSEDELDVPDPCPGLHPPGDPEEPFNDECLDITECTQMEEKPEGCYCAYCGPVGASIKCIKVICN
jgi:hypothetical protein